MFVKHAHSIASQDSGVCSGRVEQFSDSSPIEKLVERVYLVF